MAKPAVLTEYTVFSPKLTRGLEIALVTDLHERRAPDILRLLGRAKPDLIAVAGDTLESYAEKGEKTYRTIRYNAFKRFLIGAGFHLNHSLNRVFGRNNPHEPEFAFDFLRRAARLAPVFMSLGNHEESFPDDYRQKLRELGVTLLDNADTELVIKGQRLRLGGLSSVYDREWLDRFSKKDGCKLLLCHHPEYYDELIDGEAFDLVLAGHTHGGQIRLFDKAIFSPGGGLFPKYGGGLYDGRLAVSRGCSNTAAMPRLNNPRELVLIHFKGNTA